MSAPYCVACGLQSLATPGNAPQYTRTYTLDLAEV